jgi:hypothetical protein
MFNFANNKLRNYHNSDLLLFSKIKADNIYNETIRDNDFTNLSIIDVITITRIVKKYNDINNLFNVTIEVYDDKGKIIYKRNDLICKN